MPCIICSYCMYVGQGKGIFEQYSDVLKHEKICEENPDIDDNN